MTRLAVGKLGEDIACSYLKNKGYTILENNFRTRFGELDIVVQKENRLVFIEVKTRIGRLKGKPYESVNLRKLSHLKRAINYFLKTKDFHTYKLRLDVITIVLNDDQSVDEMKHFENVELNNIS